MKLSVVISIFNEEENIPDLCAQLYKALDGIDYEIIFVDDGSTDRSLEMIRQHANKRTQVVEFMKNFGQSPAMKAGIDHARGAYIVTMDGDLQNDPADIPAMLHKAESENWDVVAGRRANRKDHVLIRKTPSKIANWIIRNSTDVRLNDYGCSLRVYRAQIARDLDLYGELHRFIPVLASMQGARMTEVDVNHRHRIHGQSKYGLWRTFKVIVDLILMLFFRRYLQRPMHLFGGIGILLFGLGVLINLYLLYEKIIGHDIWGRPLLILGFILLVAGIQFITIGIVVDLLMRVYFESQDKKIYRVREVHRFGE